VKNLVKQVQARVRDCSDHFVVSAAGGHMGPSLEKWILKPPHGVHLVRLQR